MSRWTRRRLLMASAAQQSGRLGADYQEVQWLQGTGTQYCETDVYPKNDNGTNFIGIKGNLTVLDKQNSSFSIGATWSDRTTSNPRTMQYKCYYLYGRQITPTTETYTARFILNDGLPNHTHVSLELTNNVFPVDIHYELNKRNVVVNQTTYDKSTMLAYNSNRQIIIGGTSSISDGVSVDNNLVRVKQIDVYNIDTLLYEFVPCYRKSDSKTGFCKIDASDGTVTFFPSISSSNEEWLIGPSVG